MTDPLRVRVCGPLELYARDFGAELLRLGYGPTARSRGVRCRWQQGGAMPHRFRLQWACAGSLETMTGNLASLSLIGGGQCRRAACC